MFKVGVIGAGALGTSIAQSISKNLKNVYLYGRRQKVVDDINQNSYNEEYYPNIRLRDNIIGTNDLNEFNDADCIILTIPSSSLVETMKKLTKIIPKKCIIVSTIKGIEKKTSKTSCQIINEYSDNPVAALSGPNIASEIILDLPAATTIAVKTDEEKEILYKIFQNDKFNVQFNEDILGTELCGILKNILAISFGICEGLNINDSAKFAVLNKGFVEMMSIITELGGDSSTILNYCGFGDMVTASTLPVSRNHTLGVLYGQKIIIDEKATGVVFEGKNSITNVKKICDKNNIESDIVTFVNEVIMERLNPKESFEKLWKTI